MKYIITLLTASILFSAPAIAAETPTDHHGHTIAGHGMNMEGLMKDGRIYAARALDLMAAGNNLMENGSKKKDATLMLDGAQVFNKGLKMHHSSMHAMQELYSTLKNHLMKAKVGDMQMDTAAMADLEKTMQGLKAGMESISKSCHAEMAKMPANASALSALGNDQITEGKKHNHAAKLLTGAALMEAGMAMHLEMSGAHHGTSKGHHKTTVEKRVRVSGSGHEVSSHKDIKEHIK